MQVELGDNRPLLRHGPGPIQRQAREYSPVPNPFDGSVIHSIWSPGQTALALAAAADWPALFLALGQIVDS